MYRLLVRRAFVRSQQPRSYAWHFRGCLWGGATGTSRRGLRGGLGEGGDGGGNPSPQLSQSRSVSTSRVLWAKKPKDKVQSTLKTAMLHKREEYEQNKKARAKSNRRQSAKKGEVRKAPRKVQVQITVPYNERIEHSEVMLIDDAGKAQGIVPIREAIARTKEKGFCLAQVGKAVEGKPVVCKMTTLDSLRKAEETKIERKKAEVLPDAQKLFKCKHTIAPNDLAIKVTKARRHLLRGLSVSFLVLKGDSQTTSRILTQVVDDLKDVGEALRFKQLLIEEKCIMVPLNKKSTSEKKKQ